jgi:hypothetical protein
MKPPSRVPNSLSSRTARPMRWQRPRGSSARRERRKSTCMAVFMRVCNTLQERRERARVRCCRNVAGRWRREPTPLWRAQDANAPADWRARCDEEDARSALKGTSREGNSEEGPLADGFLEAVDEGGRIRGRALRRFGGQIAPRPCVHAGARTGAERALRLMSAQRDPTPA